MYALESNHIHDQHEGLIWRLRCAAASCIVSNHTLLTRPLLQYRRPQSEPSSQLAIQLPDTACEKPGKAAD